MTALVDVTDTSAAMSFGKPWLGPWKLTGLLSGFGVAQSNPVAGDRTARIDVSNGFLFLQKNSGLLQFYFQAGAYNIPIVGVTFLSTGLTTTEFFGPLPVVYVKLAPTAHWSIIAGKLPSPVGPENTFDFQDLNIERGLLWNQENDVERGVQVGYAQGKFSGSLMWNDGYYSNRYNWLTGTAAWKPSTSDTLELDAGGNLGRTGYSTAATPLYQNNSAMYALTYTHIARRWLLQPYAQYTRVPRNLSIGVGKTTATLGVALLGKYYVRPHFFVGGRAEFLGSTGTAADGSVNLLYGPGSHAASFTITPTYRRRHVYLWEEFSVVHAGNTTTGDAFGPQGNASTQVRGMVEAGTTF